MTALSALLLGAPLAAAWLARRLSRGSARWVAAVTAGLVSASLALLVEPLAWLGFAALAAAWGAAVAVDLAERHLPDLLTLAPFPLFFLLQLPWAVVEGGWVTLGRALLGSLITAATLFALAYLNPSGFGLGDVKLGLTTGAALGWFGLGEALAGIAAAFILMAVISGLLLAVRRLKRETEIAFGPFMILGVLVTPAAARLLGW